MAEPRSEHHAAHDAAHEAPRDGRGAAERTPRWVIVFGVAALLLALVFVVLHLAGGGPRGHMGP